MDADANPAPSFTTQVRPPALPGPVFGYMIEGRAALEIHGRPEQVIRAGQALWEPGGAVNVCDDEPIERSTG